MWRSNTRVNLPSADLLGISPVLICVLIQATIAYSDVVGTVVAVTDGDTIKILDKDKIQHKIRLTGIDAPEKKQPFGSASRKFLSDIIAGQKVYIQSDKTDRYGRTLGKVLYQNRDINLEMVTAGMAWWYRHYAKEQPELDRRLYESAESIARESRIGLWAESAPIAPWQWSRR